MAKPEKVEKVAQIKKLFEEANSIFVTDYQGLNVADMTTLRKALRDNNVTYVVAKNTLLKIAANEAGVNGDVTGSFEGPTAVAFCSDDPSGPAKVLYDSFKERELPRIKVFVLEDEVHSPDDVKRLAELPPKEILLAQLIAAVESPITSVIGSIEGIMRKLVGTIDAIAAQKQSE